MKFERKHYIYLAIGFFSALMLFGLYKYTKIIENLELRAVNGMFYMRNDPTKVNADGVFQRNPRLNDKIVIIGIDDAALVDFGRFPWQRKVYYDFMKKFKSVHTAAIFFDIFFVEKSDPVNDGFLIKGTKQYNKNNIFYDYPPKAQKENDKAMGIMNRRLPLMDKWAHDAIGNMEYLKDYKYFSIPLPELLRTASGVGHAAIEPDTDSVYRKMPLVIKCQEKLYEQVIFSIALKYFKVKKENVEIILGKKVILKDAQIPIKDDFGDVVDHKTEDIEIPVDAQGKMMINFVGPQGEFKNNSQYYSFADAMKMEPENFQDKILFIGMYAQGSTHDAWPTPHEIMYGIEINANALSTILERDFITFMPAWANLLIVLFLGLLIGFIVPRVKIWQSAVVIIVLILVLSVVVFGYVFANYNKIMLYWTPLLTIIIGYIGTLLYRILTEEKDKKFIKDRFSKYVSSSVVDELLKNPKALQLGGEDRYITVFFSDVRGFTTISEKLGEPQKLVALLNEYLSAMTEIIFQNKGTLDKYVGDEIMAFWGAPIPQEDHTYLACKTALAQIKYLNEVLYPKLESENKPLLYIGIGINTGTMTVGNMGSSSRMDYTLMGDEVNLGARLEGTNKVYGTTIIISEFAYEEVKDKVIARELDIIRVKGKTKPVRIYELIDLKDEVVELPQVNT